MVFPIGKYELQFITAAIKQVLENMFFRYITGAKKIKKEKDLYKSAGIGPFKLY